MRSEKKKDTYSERKCNYRKKQKKKKKRKRGKKKKDEVLKALVRKPDA